MPKTIMITGAAKGIGMGVAHEMARRGYDLFLSDILFDELEKVRGDINAEYPSARVETIKLDVTDYEKVFETVNEYDEKMGGFDIVYANAGIFYDGWTGQGNFHKYKETVEINLLGTMATVDAAVGCFRKRKRGHIVVPSSVAAFRALRGSGGYCAAKSGIAIFAETVRTELLKDNIKVTVLYPGYIDTDLNRGLKSRPFLISLEKGSKIIADMIEKQVKSTTIPVFPWNIIKYLFKILPVKVMAKI